MYSPFRLALKYLNYLLTSNNGKGHGIHSPFVFDLVTLVLNDKGDYYCYQGIEELRQLMLKNDLQVEVSDLGAGSRKGTIYRRKVSDIARTALKPPKYSKLLFRLANYFKCRTIIELGTSLGITTCYLASVHHNEKVFTLEGVPAIAGLAKENFEKLGLKNIELVEGNFDLTLPAVLEKAGKTDLAFIDGNHRFEPTLRYFEQIYPYLHAGSVVIFDDIHWSAEMEEAWLKIKSDPRVTLSVDLFFIGLVFFDPSIRVKQDFVIRF